jgi:DNA-binding transcriptional ArsR family regulator
MDVERIAIAEKQADIFQIFSNARRILIMWTLENQEMSVGDIAAIIGATLPSTSQHLRLMKDKGVLASRKEGQTIYYSIRADKFGKNCQKMLSRDLPSKDIESNNL